MSSFAQTLHSAQVWLCFARLARAKVRGRTDEGWREDPKSPAPPGRNWLSFARFAPAGGPGRLGPRPFSDTRCQIGFVLHKRSARRRSVANPQSAIRNRGIGFVLPRPIECSIHHNSLLTKHLPFLLLRRKLASFRTTGFPHASSSRCPRPPKFGFVSHNRLFVGWASSPDLFRIGFVLPKPIGCSIHHNSFPAKPLPVLTLWRKLALFRTLLFQPTTDYRLLPCCKQGIPIRLVGVSRFIVSKSRKTRCRVFGTRRSRSGVAWASSP